MAKNGSKAIRAIFEDAVRATKEDHILPLKRDYNLAFDGIKPGQWDGFPFFNLPPKCPVKPIGRDALGVMYCLSATGHLRKVEKFDQPTLASLFAPYIWYAFWSFPRFANKGKKSEDPETGEIKELPPQVERLEVQKLATCLIQAAAEAGDFDPNEQHRGRGGWADSTGAFIWHSGEELWMKSSTKGQLVNSRPMQHDGYLYTRQKHTITPWLATVTQEESPALRILKDMQTWNWERPYLDPLLLLGWLATALMGGALPERPIIFTTGGRGVGKTTLQGLLKQVLTGVSYQAADTTAAGIYQKVGQDALPFIIDELEAKAGSSKAQSIIELARIAYSGGDGLRGGADGNGTSFKMFTSFFFSAIHHPPMGSQDKSRMAILNLNKLQDKGGPRKAPVIKAEDARMILRQIIDGFEDYNANIKPYYWKILHDEGFDARQIDTYGTLLAAAEMMIGPAAMEDVGLPISSPAHLGEILRTATEMERNEVLEPWHKCLNILFDTPIDAWRDGIKPMIGTVCENFRSNVWDLKGSREKLELVNLSVCDTSQRSLDLPGRCLAIPGDGTQLMKIFAGTDFYDGGWMQALKQAPADIVIKNSKDKQMVKISGTGKRCLFIDLQAFHRFTGSVD